MDCLSVSEKTANENSWVIIARSKLFKKLILGSSEFKMPFFESLILAQDERWRRA